MRKEARALTEDDTRRQRGPSEEAPHVWEAAFHDLLELAPDPVVVCNHMDITELNTAACTLFGYRCEELVGKPMTYLLEPDDVPRFLGELPTLPGLVHVGEWRAKRKDGTSLLVEARHRVLSPKRRVAFLRDVSELRLAERERDEWMRWLRAVFDQAPIAMVLAYGPQAQEVEFNACAQRAFEREKETLDECLARVAMPDGQPLPRSALPLEKALRGRTQTVGAELLIRNAAGRFLPFAVHTAPITSRDGQLLGAVAAFEDLTAPKELERLRAEWSSVVAHDLRHPLATIALGLQMIARSSGDAKILKHSERALGAANRLNRMVGDLMDLSRLEASRLQLVRQRVDVPALVRAAAERAELETTDRPFAVHIDGDIPKGYADPDRIAQVLENLLTNAVKYGQAGTPIRMSVTQDGDEVAVVVANEGRGLTAEELAHIFERFQRTASAKLEGIEGVGLGLYITRALVEAHGGRIQAESAPGGTTTFRFTLPVA